MEIPVEASTTRRQGKIKTILSEVRVTFKEAGFRGIFKRYGWKVVAGVFAYYLVRDTLLYLVIPWMIAKHFIAE